MNKYEYASKISGLAKEALDNNEKAVAAILYAVAGSLWGDFEIDFANFCVEFAKQSIKAMHAQDN